MKLLTKRLRLKEPERKDLVDIVENINNLKVTKWLLVVPYPYTMKDARIFLKKSMEKRKAWPRKDYNFWVELKDEGRVIGGIGLHKVDRWHGTAEVGYWLGERYWRKGYGAEALNAVINFAFKKLRLRRLYAGVFDGNPSSGKLLEKLGFRHEGLKRKAKRCKADKKLKDEHIYGLLREEYRKR